MKNFLKQYSKYFVLAFMLGAFMPGNLGQFIQTDVTSYNNLSIDQTLEAFHYERMNETVNEFLERLTAEDNPNVSYVDKDNCDNTNASTYCLAVKLNEYLLEFEQVMVEDKSKEIEFDSDGVLTLEEALETAASQDTIIDDQIRSARDALDLTLSVYNQIQMVYPIHKELKLLQLNLEEYRDNLGGIRDIVELYPSKFNDASTVSCQ